MDTELVIESGWGTGFRKLVNCIHFERQQSAIVVIHIKISNSTIREGGFITTQAMGIFFNIIADSNFDFICNVFSAIKIKMMAYPSRKLHGFKNG